jgi:autotransporter-associated beta strand protein
VIWDGGSGSGSAWLTAANWAGDALPTSLQIAQFGSTGSASTIGINLNGSTNNGANNQAIGAIEIASTRSTAIAFNNSSTSVDGTLTLMGATVSGASNIVIRNASGATASFNNGSSRLMNLALANTTDNVVAIDGAGGITINANISGAGKHMTLSGAGSGALTLAGTNTFSGGFTLSSGAKLNVNNASALGTGTFTISGGTIDNSSSAAITNSINNVQAWNGDFTFSGTKDLNLGTGAVTLGATRNLSITAGRLTVGGVINDSGSAYGIANSFTGALTINNGTLQLGASNAIADAVNVVVNAITAGATAVLDLNGASDTIGSLTFGGTSGTSTSTNNVLTGLGTLSLGGNVTFDATGDPLPSSLSGHLALGASRVFTIGDSTNAATELTVSAVVSGPGFSLTKNGNGTMSLTGANTYSGGTSITAGTLAAGSSSALGSGVATISSGATLSVGSGLTLVNNITVAGTLTAPSGATFGGTISGTGSLSGTLTIASGGSIAPGSSPGHLTVASGSTLTFASGSTYAWELGSLTTGGAGTNFDLITLAGTAQLATNSVFLVPAFAANQAPNQGDSFWNSVQSWTVVSGNASSTITGTFQVNNTSWSGKGTFATALSGNDLLLNWTPSAIPEPSAFGVIFGIGVLGFALWSKRRTQNPNQSV